MRLRGAGEATIVALAALALTAVLTYPLAFQIDRIGRVNTDDGRFSLWNVAWVAHALTTDPRTVYDANIFYPHGWTLAFSEANLGAGTMAVPIWLLTKNPYTSHNVVVIAGFVLSALGAYFLARRLTGSRAAAAVAAVLFAFCPFIFARTAHIQLLLTFGMPWSLLAFHWLVDRPTVGRAVALGLLLWWTALCCGYYGIFAAMMVGAGTLFFAFARGLWRQPDYWIGIGLAAFVSVALTLPFFLPYVAIQREQGFARTLDDARAYSANWEAWLASSAWAHRWWLPAIEGYSEVLFPGILATGLGLVATWKILLRPAAQGPWAAGRRDVAMFYLAIAILAVWMSFGPDGGLYALSFRAIPVASFLRAPGRMGIVTMLGLSMLAAMTVRAWLHARPRAGAMAAGLVILAAAELMTAPLVQLRPADPVPDAYRLLATLPRGPVAEFPFYYRRSDFPRHAYYMLQSTTHWQPLVNGYSDHIPADFRRSVLPLSSFPSRESFGMLARAGTRYVVFHRNLYDRRSLVRLDERLQVYSRFLRPILQDGDVWLFEIVDWPG